VQLQHRRMPFPYAILSFNELLSLRVPQHEPVRRSIRSASATSRCRKRQVAASPAFIITFLQLRSSAPRWDLPGSTMSTCESCSQGMKLRAEWPSSVSAAALTSVTRPMRDLIVFVQARARGSHLLVCNSASRITA
jgi:hypothetical protein